MVGGGLIAVRLALAPAGPAALLAPPAGDGPWSLVVVSTGSPRDGHQSATLSTPPGVAPAFVVAATLPRYPEVIAGDPVRVDGAIRPPPESAYGEYLARIGAIGTLTARTLEVGTAPTDPARRLRTCGAPPATRSPRSCRNPRPGWPRGS